MPKFYFHLSNSFGSVKDEEGRTMPDLRAAIEQAKEDIRSILSEELKGGVVDLRGRMEIADVSGNVVAAVPFSDAVQLRLDEGDAPVAKGPRGMHD